MVTIASGVLTRHTRPLRPEHRATPVTTGNSSPSGSVHARTMRACMARGLSSSGRMRQAASIRARICRRTAPTFHKTLPCPHASGFPGASGLSPPACFSCLSSPVCFQLSAFLPCLLPALCLPPDTRFRKADGGCGGKGENPLQRVSPFPPPRPFSLSFPLCVPLSLSLSCAYGGDQRAGVPLALKASMSLRSLSDSLFRDRRSSSSPAG